MLTFLRGSGASLIAASVVYYCFVFSLEGFSPAPALRSFEIGILFIAIFNYVGGLIGWGLITTFTRIKVNNHAIAILVFALIGLLFAVMLSMFVRFTPIFYAVTILGSVCFYLAQFVKNKKMSYLLAFGGPIIFYILYLTLRFVY